MYNLNCKLKINSIKDIEKQTSGRLAAILNWYRYIKTYDGKK